MSSPGHANLAGACWSMLATMRGATGACERAAARCRRKPVQPPAPMAPGASGTGRFADGEKRLRPGWFGARNDEGAVHAAAVLRASERSSARWRTARPSSGPSRPIVWREVCGTGVALGTGCEERSDLEGGVENKK